LLAGTLQSAIGIELMLEFGFLCAHSRVRAHRLLLTVTVAGLLGCPPGDPTELLLADDDSADGDDDDSADPGDDDTTESGQAGCDILVPDDLPSLQAALDAANPGQRICAAEGTYLERPVFDGRGLHLRSLAGASLTTIDGQDAGPVVVFAGGGDTPDVLEGFTILGGGGGLGGGVQAVDGSVILRDLVVTANRAEGDGGGGALRDSAAWLDRVVISGNRADGEGGGLYLEGGTALLTGCAIGGNEAGAGGGGLAAVGASLVFDGAVEDNTAGGDGGGVLLRDATASLEGVSLASNGAGGHGGGLRAEAAVLGLDGGWIAGNLAGEAGGGLSLATTAGSLRHLRIEGNHAASGGGMALDEAAPQVSNLMLLGNHATDNGGGGRIADGAPSLSQTTIHGNTATDGGGLYLSHAPVTLTAATITGNAAGGEGGGLRVIGAAPTVHHGNLFSNQPDAVVGMDPPSPDDGNLEVTPDFLDVVGGDSTSWDLHLDTGSALIAGGAAGANDPAGGPAAIGAFGGPGAGGWDLDRDGFPSWWQPGPYDDDLHPGEGWDCDDGDPAVFPGSGC